MISMSTFLSVRALLEEGTPKKTIARRLGIDVRTVRKYLRRIELGAKEPRRPIGPARGVTLRDRTGGHES